MKPIYHPLPHPSSPLRCLASLAVGICGLAATEHAGAAVLFGYNAINTPANPITFNVTGYSFIASRFTVGASDVDVDYIDYYAGGNGSVTTSIAIYGAKAGSLDGFQPDALISGAIGSFTPVDTAAPWEKVSVTFAGGPVTLSANTNYYIVVDASGVTSTAAGGFVSTVAQSGQFTEISPDHADPANRLITSSNGGSTWANYSASSFLPYQVGLSEAVPEPSSFLLSMLAGGGMLVRRRR